MTTPADANAPAPAQRDAESAWGTRIALGVVMFVLVVEFVLPGFVMAGLSRAFMSGYVPSRAVTRVLDASIAPAYWLMAHSDSINRFYMWEYRLGGAKVYTL